MYNTYCHYVQHVLSLCTTRNVIMYNTYCHYVQHVMSLCTTRIVIMYNTYCHYVQHVLSFSYVLTLVGVAVRTSAVKVTSFLLYLHWNFDTV